MLSAPSHPRRRSLLVIIAFTLIFTSIPYLLAAGGDAAWTFSGFVFGVEDGNSYLGKMRLGMRGAFAFYLFYTPEQHASAPLINLPYLITGWIAGRFVPESDPRSHGALILAFHAFRLAADALLIVVMDRFIGVFIADGRGRRLALLLALFGGGIGWLLALTGQSDLLGSLPADLYIPEGFSFQVLFGLPHLALARAALLMGFVILLGRETRAFQRSIPTSLNSLAAGLCWLAVGVIVPFYLAVIYAVLGAWGLAIWLRTRRFPFGLAMAGGSAALVASPALIYNALVFAGNPAFGVWSGQNILPSPHPLHYLFAYGLLIGAAALGIRAIWRRAGDDTRWLLLLGWIAIAPILVYLPINVQRRLSEAVIVPLAILAALGVMRWRGGWDFNAESAQTGRKREQGKGRVEAVFLLLVSLSAAFLWLGGLITALNPRPPAYLPTPYAAAFAWLNAPDGGNAHPDDVILASVPMGNALPAYVRARVYMGHGPETLFWRAKTDIVARFYGGTLTEREYAALFDPPCPPSDGTLCLFPVRYIVYGDAERALLDSETPSADPAWAQDARMTQVYDADGVAIYRVGESQTRLRRF